jgi:hypothetical protein
VFAWRTRAAGQVGGSSEPPTSRVRQKCFEQRKFAASSVPLCPYPLVARYRGKGSEMSLVLVDDRDGRVITELESPEQGLRLLEAMARDDPDTPEYLCIAARGVPVHRLREPQKLPAATRPRRPRRGKRVYGPPGPSAAGGGSIDSRTLTRGVSGTRTSPRTGRSRSKVISSSIETNAAARTTLITPRARMAR